VLLEREQLDTQYQEQGGGQWIILGVGTSDNPSRRGKWGQNNRESLAEVNNFIPASFSTSVFEDSRPENWQQRSMATKQQTRESSPVFLYRNSRRDR